MSDSGKTLSLLNIPAYDSATESDVEQKFIFPLLTHLSFLAIPPKTILTKKSMGSLSFTDKTTLPKNYVPDDIVFFNGLPVMVVEGKAPDVAVSVAIGEARLYADVLNRQFPTKLNPIEVVVGCNGNELAVGPVDSNQYDSFAVNDLVVGSGKLDALRKRIGVEALSAIGEKHLKKVTTPRQIKPAKLLDPQLFLDRVKPNALAPYLSPLYEMFFRAEDPEKIQLILEQAYVDTAELREYDQVVHSMLRQIERALPAEYRTIQTDRKAEYTISPELSRYEGDTSQGRMHLIIGARGSGKSLFIARFFSHLMPEALKASAAWCVIDFNRAPSSIDNIDDFICEKFLETALNVQFDPYSTEGLHRVFAQDINRLTKGALAGISDENEKQRMLAQELLRLSADKRNFALKLARHITGEAARPLIIAFDNVDRLESAQQLRIFQAAQWFRSETRAFALLTLRDVTFEHFKDSPPLDAFAQISNFYIRPPRFALVLQKRLKLAIDIGLKQIEVVEQSTETGLRFKYSRDQLGVFLQTVYDALFASEHQVGRILDALAERDVREALGMFSRMLSSGHFNADRVIRIGTGGSADIKQDMLIKILMRAEYRVYSEDAGFVKNVFAPPDDSYTGNIFITGEILGFFAQTQGGTSTRLGGYRTLEELLSDMASMGFGEDEVRSKVHVLIKYKMLTYDGEDTESPADRDLIKITPSGFIHLRTLPHFIEYISSVALSMPFDDPAVARRIATVWSHVERYTDLNFSNKHQVASMVADYLIRHKNRLDAENPLFKARAREAERLVHSVTGAVNATENAAARERGKITAVAKARRAASETSRTRFKPNRRSR
jgi:hypothetical protein